MLLFCNVCVFNIVVVPRTVKLLVVSIPPIVRLLSIVKFTNVPTLVIYG